MIANLAGRAWTMGLGVVFIPVYLHFLGIEAYGLVGFFATLQGVLGFLDLGLGATINRELARLSARPDQVPQQRAVLRTLEICYWAMSLAGGLGVVTLAPAIAHHWVHAAKLSPQSIERAVRLMGIVLVLQPPFAFYQAALMGLQRQVLLNGILVATATTQSIGTALVLWLISPSIEAFFLCQTVVTLVQTLLAMIGVWAPLGGVRSARPALRHLASVWRYAAATAANSLVGVTLTQLDKVILSRLLSLELFGYYALAGTMASFVWAIAIPVNQALFPKFAQLLELGEGRTLAALYHRASQVMAIAIAPAAATVALFSWDVMLLWTHSATTADHTALVASLLIAGTAVNGLVSVPGYFQSAAGWPELMAYTNSVAAIVLVPAIVFMTARYGAAGAASVWLMLNAGYLVSNVPIMHTRLLRGEQRRWYLSDLALPVTGAVAIALAGRWFLPDQLSRGGMVAAIGGVWLAAVIVCTLLASDIRPLVFRRPLSFAAASPGR